MVIDHVCHNDDLSCAGGNACRHRRCFNPAHLAVTSRSQNIRNGRAGAWGRSKTHCPKGIPTTRPTRCTASALTALRPDAALPVIVSRLAGRSRRSTHVRRPSGKQVLPTPDR